MSEELLDCLGRRRSPAATSAFHTGRRPGNRGLRYPADPPPVEEIIAVMRAAGDGPYGDRLRGMIVVLWRAGLRIGEALALAETDLDPARGAITIRRGKGGKRRQVGMDQFGWQHLDLSIAARCRSARCSASCMAPPTGDRGLRPRSATSCGMRRRRLGFGGGWRRISCATPTRSSSPTKAYRWSSSSAN